VEAVIESSIQKHERMEAAAAVAASSPSTTTTATNTSSNNNALSETARLRLELNDISCGIAAGVVYGGMHTVLLYGTLLASEMGQKGTLYQPSCSSIPSLVNSAIVAFGFGILDLVWMMMTFYGMRRWSDDEYDDEMEPSWGMAPGRVGGKTALMVVLITHLAASFATLPNATREVDGCQIALPSLGVVVLVCLGFFGTFIWKNYLPQGQKRRIQQMSMTRGVTSTSDDTWHEE